MIRRASLSLILLGALLLPGCGSLQGIVVEAAEVSAKQAVEQAIDEVIGSMMDEVLDLDGFLADDAPPGA